MERGINELTLEVREINIANKWDTVELKDFTGSDDPFKIPSKLALLHSEVSEALEAYRAGDLENFIEELADTLIRTMDIAGGVTDDFKSHVLKKMEKNRNRGIRHGGKKV